MRPIQYPITALTTLAHSLLSGTGVDSQTT